MQEMKKVVIVNGKVIVDIDTLYSPDCWLSVNKQRKVEMTYYNFQYELCPLPPSPISSSVLGPGQQRTCT